MASEDNPRKRRTKPQFFANYNFAGDFLGGNDDAKETRRAAEGYYLGADRISPSRFSRLSTEKQAAVMIEWFGTRYEDPVHSLSYNSREGGYLWGDGPYDASDVLAREFGSIAKERAVERAVEQITSDGTYEWAPVRNEYDNDGTYPVDEPFPDISDLDIDDEAGGDHALNAPASAHGGAPFLVTGDGAGIVDDRGNRLVFGVDDVALRNDVERNLQILDRAVADFQDLVRRTHNNPPALLNDLQPTEQLIERIVSAQLEMRAELAVATPNERNVERQISIFQRLGRIVGAAVGVVVTGVVGNAASEIIKGDYGIPLALFDALNSVANAAQLWFQSLPPPF